jgi:hypothetical protein
VPLVPPLVESTLHAYSMQPAYTGTSSTKQLASTTGGSKTSCNGGRVSPWSLNQMNHEPDWRSSDKRRCLMEA